MTESVTAQAGSLVNVDDMLANRPLSGLTIGLAVLLALVLITDGFDIVVLGVLAPAISEEFGLSRLEMGWFLTWAHIGVAAGGIIGGLAGDRLGRRIVLLVSVLGFGCGTMVCALIEDPLGFVSVRFVASMCMGAAAPNVAIYLLELLPAQWNTRLSILAYAAYALGSTLCSITSRALLPVADWRVIFVIGGIAPLVLLMPLLLWYLPESPRFMVLAKRPGARIAEALEKLGAGQRRYSGNERFVISARTADPATMPRFSMIASHSRSLITLSLMALLLYLASIGLSSMGTLILTGMGLTLPEAVTVLLAHSVAGLGGALLASFTVYRFGSRATLASLLCCSAASLAGLGFLATAGHAVDGLRLVVLFALTGFGLTSSLMVIFPLAAQAFSTAVRSTLTGTVSSIGRVGSIMSSAVVALVLTAGGPATVFIGLAVTAGAAAAAAFSFDRHIPGSTGARQV